jgi:hypothetical protein
MGDARRVSRAGARGLPMGDGWYLAPSRSGSRGAATLACCSRRRRRSPRRLALRGDSAALDLAQRQAQWIVGRNPFAQSTMYGEGYDWAQQYSVSSGDFVGSLPVGMQSSGTTDLPYLAGEDMYVYKEVWVTTRARAGSG